MKVVHIITVSDSLAFFRDQPPFYRDHGVDFVMISRPDEELVKFGLREQVRTIGVPMSRKISPLSDIAAIWKLVRALREERPDIVHAHTPKGGLLGTIASRIARVPVTIYHIRGLPYMGLTGGMRRLMMTTERVSCRMSDAVFCVGHSIAEVAIRDSLVPPKKVRVFGKGGGDGVDSRHRFNPSLIDAKDTLALRKELRIDPDAIVCLYIGRLTGDKGIRELAVAWERVAITHPSARLILVGSQDERLPLDSETMQQLEDIPSVVLAGRQSNAPLFYAASDIVVLPSYREGFPNVLLEASSMKRSIITTRVPGCIDAVEEGVTGDLVSARDPIELENAITSLIEDSARRESYGVAGRQRIIEHFDSQLIFQSVLDEYIQLSENQE